MKKAEIKKVVKLVGTSDYKGLQEIVKANTELTGFPSVGLKTEVFKEKLIGVLQGDLTVESVKQEAKEIRAAGKLAKSKEVKETAKEDPKPETVDHAELIEKVGNCSKVKKLHKLIKKTEVLNDVEKVDELIKQATLIMAVLKPTKKADPKPETETPKIDKATKKLIKKVNKAADKKTLKVLIAETEVLNEIKTKKVSFEDLVASCLAVLNGAPTEDKEAKKSNRPAAPDCDVIAKVKGKKAFQVERVNTVYGHIQECLLTAKKDETPITLEQLFKSVCKLQKTTKEARKTMWKEKNGLFTTCRVSPKKISQTLFNVTITGTGEDRTFIAS